MTLVIEQPAADELGALAALAAVCQASPDRQIPYLDEAADSIEADILDGAGDDSWTERTVVARRDGVTVGWLYARTDREIGRVWWNGPFVSVDVDGDEAAEIADALYDAAAPLRAGFSEEELSYDRRSTTLAAFAARHGFAAETASRVLQIDLPFELEGPSSSDLDVAAPNEDTKSAVAALHDELFPGTHATGARIATPTSANDSTWCLVIDGEVAGYIAVERQNDGNIYIDFVGVSPQHRRRGLAKVLVVHALEYGGALGAAHAHLTVRVDNEGAERLYRSLGFGELVVIVPARKGFRLAPTPA